MIPSLFVGCAQFGGAPNACEIDAVVKQAVYRDECRSANWYWSKILIVHWNDNQTISNHALCAYVYKDRLLVYDYWNGAREVPIGLRNSATTVAQYLYGSRVSSAFFLEDSQPARGGRLAAAGRYSPKVANR